MSNSLCDYHFYLVTLFSASSEQSLWWWVETWTEAWTGHLLLCQVHNLHEHVTFCTPMYMYMYVEICTCDKQDPSITTYNLCFLSLLPFSPSFSSLLPSLSGAVYRGQWERGVKEGCGTFTFKNGGTYSGLFHRDRMALHEESGEVLLRPRTPLGSLIG